MASMVAVCCGLGRKKLRHFLTAAFSLPNPGTHAGKVSISFAPSSTAAVALARIRSVELPLLVLWRSCSQYEQVTSNEDLPVPMENPYKEPLKKCILCGKRVDYKNVQLLSQFISPFTGCIHGRHITGLCGKKQKEVTKAIKRAQIMGFMPVTFKDPAYLKDPKVCNIRYRE